MANRTRLLNLIVLAAVCSDGPLVRADISTPQGTGAPAKPDSLAIHPPRVQLRGLRGRQQIIVVGQSVNGRQQDCSRQARVHVQNPQVATIDREGVVRPLANGRTTIHAEFQGHRAEASLEVQCMETHEPVDFVREVVPILTKKGCNQGACHGGQHGKGGFRLSLRGYDPAFDHTEIVYSAEGRRAVVVNPEQSLLLLKPTLAVEHRGGLRLQQDSEEYQVLRQWLADGAPPPPAEEPEVASLDVWPKQQQLQIGEKQQLVVRALWNNGRAVDVTHLAQYDSLNEGVAEVAPGGLVTARGKGETHIMIRFHGQASVMRVTLPYGPAGTLAGFAPNNFIDRKIAERWQELGLTPAPLAGDEEFFRRLHLDAIGTLPEPAAIKAFLASKEPGKRRQAIEQVLDRPEYVDFWALKWGDLLRINRTQLNEKGMWSFHNWVRAALRDNRPIDQMVREIITAEGSTYTEGPVNFYRTGANAADWAENTAQLFLGVRLQCARCHHHPFEKWSQDDYYGLAAFFVRLGTKNSQEFGIFGRETVVYLRNSGEQTHPRKRTVVKPHPPDGPVLDDEFDRRRLLADWLTARDNPFFARNLVNRFWGYLMGRGFVEPLDDLRATNPPSNPVLLDALARDFAEHGYDLKHLLRTILNSRVYQLSSTAAPASRPDVSNVYYTHYTVKRLTAEQLADAVDFATDSREKYQGLPQGTRAIQLPDTAVRSFLLDIFGRPPRQVTCECERTSHPNIAQALHLLNGDSLNRKIASGSGRIARLVSARKGVREALDELYLVTLSRLPSPEEIEKCEEWMRTAGSNRDGLQDVLWALLNSREFLFNH